MFKDDLGLLNDDKIFMKKKKEKKTLFFTNKLFIVLSFVNDIKACPNGVLYVQYQSIIEVF